MTLSSRLSFIVLGAAFALLVALAAMRLLDHRDFAAHWRSLDTNALERTFQPELVGDLPEPAARYLRQSIAPGTPLATSARLRIYERRQRSGEDNPRELRATGIVSPSRGYVWEGRRRVRWGFIAYATAFVDGEHYQRELLFGLIPLHTADPIDSTKTWHQQRILGAIVCPSELLILDNLRWEPLSADRVRLIVPLDGASVDVELHIDEQGRLLELRAAALSMTVTLSRERHFDGYVIPTKIRAETDREVRELYVDSAWFKY
jgi:hypothetical protein